ncbi:MAG: GTPase ObgE [Planctomycetota bacterium]|jgi:GTP-binding protein
MLIDRCTIFVRSGKGGHGCVSMRREKFVPKGGPDGGDGGSGGDVILVGDDSLSTLLPLTPRPHYRAESGKHGKGKSMIGADGDDRIVKIPVGTLVFDEDGELVVDIDTNGQRFVAARGGAGGLGNEHFKSATNQAPREATPGGDWEERTLRLELKLIADVGFIGMPNAGKSTLLASVSRARPKVADYPFTTLSPNLGIAELQGRDERRLVMADIPGLIEGAAEGAGLGHEFLRHIERTKVLVHLLDVEPIDGTDPVSNYKAIRAELTDYGEGLGEKTEIVAINKLDLVPDDERDARLAELGAALRAAGATGAPIALSAVTGDGTRALLEACWAAVDDRDTSGWRTAD